MCVFLKVMKATLVYVLRSCSQLAWHGAIEDQDHSHPVDSSCHLRPPFSVPTRLTAEQSKEKQCMAAL